MCLFIYFFIFVILNIVIFCRIFIFWIFICSEENVYFLCNKLCSDGIAKSEGFDLFDVFISNEKKHACSISSSGWCCMFTI